MELIEHIFSCAAYEQGLVLFSEVEHQEFLQCMQSEDFVNLFFEYIAARRDNEDSEESLATAMRILASRKKPIETPPETPKVEEKPEAGTPTARTSEVRPVKQVKQTQMTLAEYCQFNANNTREFKPLNTTSRAITTPQQQEPLVRPLVTVADVCNSLALYFDFVGKPLAYGKFVEKISEIIAEEVRKNAAFPKPQKSEDAADDSLLWTESEAPAVRDFVSALAEAAEMIHEQGPFRFEVGDFGLHACFNFRPVELPSAHHSVMRFITFDVNGARVQLFDAKSADPRLSYENLAECVNNLPYGTFFFMGCQMNREAIGAFKQHVQHHLYSSGHVSGNFVDLCNNSRMALVGMRGAYPRTGQMQCRQVGVYIYRKPNDLSSVLDGPLAKRDGNCTMCKVHRGCGARKGIRDETIYIPDDITWDFMFETFEKVGFPHCDSRKNVMTGGLSFVECFCLGIVNCYARGPVLSQMATKMHNFTRLTTSKFHQDAPYKDLPDQRHNFSVVQVNRSVKCKMHVDGNNVGPSYICAFGDFTGGETWIYDGVGPVEMTVQDNLRGYDLPIGSVVKGTLHDVKNKWVHFNGRVPHCTMPFEGKRYALVFFIHNCTGRLKDTNLAKTMDELGFTMPPIGFDYSKLVSNEDLKCFDSNPDIEDEASAHEEETRSVAAAVPMETDAVVDVKENTPLNETPDVAIKEKETDDKDVADTPASGTPDTQPGGVTSDSAANGTS